MHSRTFDYAWQVYVRDRLTKAVWDDAWTELNNLLCKTCTQIFACIQAHASLTLQVQTGGTSSNTLSFAFFYVVLFTNMTVSIFVVS